MANKRALIVEGGGMRGAHSAGVLAELAEKTSLHFDVVCGSSAGACSVSYWVAQQTPFLEQIWGHYLHEDRFIKYRRLLSSKAVMDLEYLLQEVFAKRVPLDTAKILNSPTDFFIAATHCQTGRPHYFHNKQEIDVLEALRASAAMPLAYPLPVWLHGEPFADGGIADSIPIQKALDEGCDELWIILTRPRGYRKKKLSKLPWPRWFYRKYPGLATALMQRHLLYNQQLALVEALEQQRRAFVIRPGDDMPVARFTRNQERLLAAMAHGRHDAATLLARH